MEMPTLSAALPQAWRLTVLSGPQANTHYPLGDQVRLGRGGDNEIVLADPLASRQHALIKQIGNTYVISDLGSQNGTGVNGQRINKPTTLNLHDEIIIGTTRMVLGS
jgi:pSer/pThr/pTyr-binding forkhead associated (FHA) protein